MTIGLHDSRPIGAACPTLSVSNTRPVGIAPSLLLQSTEKGTLVLCTLSAMTLFCSRLAASPSLVQTSLVTAVMVLVPWIVLICLHCRIGPWRRLTHGVPALIGIWALAPFLLEYLLLRHVGDGEPLEITLLCSLQAAALMLAAYSYLRTCQYTACLLAGFLILFSIVIGTAPIVFVFAGAFGVMMLWWLMARYWERLQVVHVASHVDRCLPVRWSILGAISVSGLILASAIGNSGNSLYDLPGFMPTSGGSQRDDPFARSGIGDGDALVGAKDDAASFGPVESELYLESKMPSLYDVANEAYGEPRISKEPTERRIALAAENSLEKEGRIATSQRGGREFSTIRKPANRKRGPLADRNSPAMLYVLGTTPAHLAIEHHDTFDGANWCQTFLSGKRSPIRNRVIGKESWIEFQEPTAIHLSTQVHAIKIVNLQTTRVPSPHQLSAIHIEKLDRPEFFAWTEDDAIYMPDRPGIPQLTVLRTRSHKIAREQLIARCVPQKLPAPCINQDVLSNGTSHAAYLNTSTLSPLMADRAAEWTRHAAPGWSQVECIVNHLRTRFVLSPDVVPPTDCPDVVAHFVKEGRGPDYLFATTAAMMLRSLGYPTRLVTGFYARPDRYDRKSRQTSVLKEDVHVWVEVLVANETWVAIEPTPGYEAPPMVLTWSEWGNRLVANGVAWTGNHWLGTVVSVLLCMLIWRTRWRWCDTCLTHCFWLMGSGGPLRRIRWTLCLLEWRCRMARTPRPAEKTPRSWYTSLAGNMPREISIALDSYLELVDRVLYDPDIGTVANHRHGIQTDRVCATVTRHLRVRQLREVRR